MLTGRDVVEAARRGRIVVAFDAQPVITAPPRVDALAVKLALAGGETSTILIDRHTATLLRRSSRVSTRCPGRAP